MTSKTALGKGLSALLATQEDIKNEFINLEISLIDPNPDQPRKVFDEQAINELADSIRENGVLQPIIVKRNKDRYFLIAGERRFRASQIARLTTIPCNVIEASETRTYEIALLENIQREGLSPLEESEAYEKLVLNYNYTHEQLAKVLGKSRSHITNVLRLKSLPEDIKTLLNEKKLTLGHAKILLSSEDKSILAKKIVDEGLSVRDTENFIHNGRSAKFNKSPANMSRSKSNSIKEGDLVEIEEVLSQKLGLNVEINDTVDGGEVIIKFSQLNELDLIISKLAN